MMGLMASPACRSRSAAFGSPTAGSSRPCSFHAGRADQVACPARGQARVRQVAGGQRVRPQERLCIGDPEAGAPEAAVRARQRLRKVNGPKKYPGLWSSCLSSAPEGRRVRLCQPRRVPVVCRTGTRRYRRSNRSVWRTSASTCSAGRGRTAHCSGSSATLSPGEQLRGGQAAGLRHLLPSTQPAPLSCRCHLMRQASGEGWGRERVPLASIPTCTCREMRELLEQELGTWQVAPGQPRVPPALPTSQVSCCKSLPLPTSSLPSCPSVIAPPSSGCHRSVKRDPRCSATSACWPGTVSRAEEMEGGGLRGGMHCTGHGGII